MAHFKAKFHKTQNSCKIFICLLLTLGADIGKVSPQINNNRPKIVGGRQKLLKVGKLARSSEVKYNVQVRDGDRWTIYSEAPTKGTATKEARNLLGSGKFDAVKVTEDRGQTQEILIFEEEAAARPQKAITITPIEEAPLCKELEDFYGYPARKMLGRLLRQHFDHEGITPFELLHDKTHIRTLTRNNDLYVQALQTVANLQTKGTDEKPLKRIDFLESMINQVSDRAQFAEDLTELEEVLKARGPGALVTAIEKDVAEENQAFALRAVLSGYFSSKADWEGKLILALDLADKKTGKEIFSDLDEFIAEILDSSEAIQELLGYQRNLAAALKTMAQLAAGTYEISEGSNSPLERLSALMANHSLPRIQETLLDRVGKAIKGVAPLTKGAREEEQDAFRNLMRALIGQKLFADSGSLCEAATLRAKSVLKEEFEDESYDKAIDNMIFLLPTIAVKFSYLLDLCGTDYGRKNQKHIIACLANVLAGLSSVTQIVERGASDKEIIVAAAGIRDRLMATELPDEWRLRFAKKIYDLLVTYKTGDSHTTISPTPEHVVAKAEREAPENAEPAAPQKPQDTKKPASGNGDDSMTRREYAAGEFIFKEGEDGNEAYLILTGQVNIIRRAGDEDIVIAQVGQGSIIGEMALIDAMPRMAAARTATDTVVTIIPSAELKTRLDRLEEFDPVMRRLVGMFVQRMRDSRIISIDS